MSAKNRNDKAQSGVNVLDIAFYLLSKWRWIVLSVAVFGLLAWVYYASRPFIYYSSATVIIKDPSNKTTTASLDRYDNLINRVNVSNEILQFKSKKLFREVIQRVHADVSYRVDDKLRYRELYTQSPVTVTFLDAEPQSRAVMTVVPAGPDSMTVSIGEKHSRSRVGVHVADTLEIGNGIRAVFGVTNYYNNSWKGKEIHVEKRPLDSMVAWYRANFGIRQEGEESSILNLSLKDESPVRARDVLNMLITVYNEEAINDKNQVAINTADFINERLIIIEKELGSVESDLELFKKDNQVVDMGTTSGIYIQQAQKYNTDVLELETQLELADYIKDYLSDPSKEVDLLPANTGINDMNIESQISQYNTVKLRRDKLIDDSSEMNPVVLELNNSLRAMKQSIIRAVDNMVVSLNVRLNDARSREQRAQSRMTSIPTQQREMLSIERQQKIKESLYMFLLNRREENALAQAMADNNARIIDEASGSMSPISPDRGRILFLGLLSGLVLPCVVFLLILTIDTRVHRRKDIEDVVDLPFIGEIPYDKNLKSKAGKSVPIVVEGTRNVISEAFRIIRTNMSFMLRKQSGCQVVTLVSMNEGAGKTFVSINLAYSLVYAKKKVVLVDLDIRKRSLSKFFNYGHYGVTDYLANRDLAIDDILRLRSDGPDIVLAGTPAPNPTELLMDSRLDDLFSKLRERYDYIIVDCVPAGIIADAAIVNRITDLTVFVIRAGRMDRRQLPDVEKMYTDRKLSNMAILLNGVDILTLNLDDEYALAAVGAEANGAVNVGSLADDCAVDVVNGNVSSCGVAYVDLTVNTADDSVTLAFGYNAVDTYRT